MLLVWSLASSKLLSSVRSLTGFAIWIVLVLDELRSDWSSSVLEDLISESYSLKSGKQQRYFAIALVCQAELMRRPDCWRHHTLVTRYKEIKVGFLIFHIPLLELSFCPHFVLWPTVNNLLNLFHALPGDSLIPVSLARALGGSFLFLCSKHLQLILRFSWHSVLESA